MCRQIVSWIVLKVMKQYKGNNNILHTNAANYVKELDKKNNYFSYSFAMLTCNNC